MTDANTEDDGLMSDPGLPNGTTLLDAQFTITRRLSAGGFGITYLAEDTILGREIVIKECFPEELCTRAGNKVIVRSSAKAKLFQSITGMFMLEARSLAKLRHPNIVGVHRAFEENGTAYMALDLIDGHDLLDILEADAGTLPTPVRVKEILLALLGAIDTIHQHDLLHRDISPDNIIIEKTGTPVLIDFGAARADASRRTRAVSSMIVVKDGYSPQEFYVSGSVQTPSSDLYALAATFYHVISGEAPPNSQIRMTELVSQNPDPCLPLAGRFGEYDPAFLEAIDKAMEVVPRNRLQSASQWHDLISDEVAPNQAHVAQPVADAQPKQVSRDLERMLTRIIEETNEDVEKLQPIMAKAVPKDVIASPVVSKPDWLTEFNAESLRKDVVIEEVDYESDQNVVDVCDVQKAQTQMMPITSDAAYSEPNWAIRVMERNEQVRDQEAQPEAALKSANSQMKFASTLVEKDDPRLSGTTYEGSRMIEPLAKYLFTGIVLGLASFILFPSLL